MTNNGVKVSIITTTFNSEKYLEETINSVILQEYPNIEYIIIDGGSTDKTLSILKKYKKYISYWVSEPDNGIYDAINKGINKANGDLIKIINSDDRLTENSISRAVKEYNLQMAKGNKEFIILSTLDRIDKNGKIISLWGRKENTFFFENLLHPSWYVPKIIYNKYGLYSLEFDIASDYQFYMNLLSNNVRTIKSQTPYTQYREGGASHGSKGKKEVIKIKKKYKGYLSALILSLQIDLMKVLSKVKRRLSHHIKEKFN